MTVRNRFYPDQEQCHPDSPEGGFCPFRFDICSIDFNAIECLMAVGGFHGFG